MDSNFLRFAAWMYTLLAISSVYHLTVPGPYMDEIFHVPQTQQYCRGDFKSWDSKITTFPGLYLVGAAYGRITNWMETKFTDKAKDVMCSVSTLRTLNLLLTGQCTKDVFNILKILHPRIPEAYRIMMTGVLALYPLHFFFAFLYYTDVGSLAAFLAAYLAFLQGRYMHCGVWSAIAVSFRQTNAVWVAWMAAVGVMQRCQPMQRGKPSGPLHHQLLHIISTAWRMKFDLITSFWPILVTPLAFGVFVVVNKGVVVGDREAHAPVLHLTQLLYCWTFIAAALAPLTLTPQRLRGLVRAVRCAPLSTVLLLATLATIVHYGTYTHPYLLADNRHYTFYIWRRTIGWHWSVRYLLVPVYAAAVWCLNISLSTTTTAAWRISLMVCTALTLVPAGLLEFRYFTVPFFLTALHLPPPSSRLPLVLILMSYLIINVVTIYTFLYRPFTWPDQSTARFMW